MLPEESLNVFMEKLLNKPIESEYYVDKRVESNLKVKFLQPFSKHKLMKFIRLNKKSNPHHVKSFYYNL